MSVKELDKLVLLHMDHNGRLSGALKAPRVGNEEGVLYGLRNIEELVVLDGKKSILVYRGELTESGVTLVDRLSDIICTPNLESEVRGGARLIKDGKIVHPGLQRLLREA